MGREEGRKEEGDKGSDKGERNYEAGGERIEGSRRGIKEEEVGREGEGEREAGKERRKTWRE